MVESVTTRCLEPNNAQCVSRDMGVATITRELRSTMVDNGIGRNVDASAGRQNSTTAKLNTRANVNLPFMGTECNTIAATDRRDS